MSCSSVHSGSSRRTHSVMSWACASSFGRSTPSMTTVFGSSALAASTAASVAARRSTRPASHARPRARSVALAEHHADAGTGLAHLGHAVLPRALAGPAEDEQVTGAGLDPPGRPAALRPQQEPAGAAERQDRHDGLLLAAPHAGAVPRP